MPRCPSFERCDFSPEMDAAGEGLVLATPPTITEPPGFLICGVFQIKSQQAREIAGGNPYRAIAILVVDTKGYHPYAFSVAGSAIMLEPAPSPPGFYRGYFNIDAFQMARMPAHPGRYYVSAYLDRFQTVPISVDWPPSPVPGG